MPDALSTARPDFPLLEGTALTIDPVALARAAQPLALVSRQGMIIAANARFSPQSGLAEASGAAVSAPLSAALDALLQQGKTARCTVEGAGGPAVFDLVALALQASAPQWLLLAHEVTIESGMRHALIESRARYMDIVALSGETGWETDEAGRFAILTAGGLAGYSARELIGRDPAQFLDKSHVAPPISPFRTPMMVTEVDVWLRHAAGVPVCYQISAVPLYDKAGAWRGARGLCRDVTEDRHNRLFLAELRNNERLLARITALFRRHSNPDDMLKAAAQACLQGLGASACQIRVVAAPMQAGDDLTPMVSLGPCGDEASLLPLLHALAADPAGLPQTVEHRGHSLLLVPAFYGGRLIGALLLWRAASQPAWNQQEKQLVGVLAGQLAVAIDQYTDYHRLLNASRTDALTGLFNRRGFDEELERRWQRLSRDNIPAALFYLDLDNFKIVNDRRGHETGDEALRHVADILRRNTRGNDLVARLGGDEFAVFVEDMADAEAVRRAKIFLAAAASLHHYSGSTRKPLQLSIGIATTTPAVAETIAALIKRADAAMYETKMMGKGNFSLAPAARPAK